MKYPANNPKRKKEGTEILDNCTPNTVNSARRNRKEEQSIKVSRDEQRHFKMRSKTMDGEQMEYLLLRIDKVQNCKVKHMKPWQPLRTCKVITTYEEFFLEKWGNQDKKKYYMGKANFKKKMLLNGEMTRVEENLEVEAMDSLEKERRS